MVAFLKASRSNDAVRPNEGIKANKGKTKRERRELMN